MSLETLPSAAALLTAANTAIAATLACVSALAAARLMSSRPAPLRYARRARSAAAEAAPARPADTDTPSAEMRVKPTRSDGRDVYEVSLRITGRGGNVMTAPRMVVLPGATGKMVVRVDAHAKITFEAAVRPAGEGKVRVSWRLSLGEAKGIREWQKTDAPVTPGEWHSVTDSAAPR
jgi:hypothetical protein